MVVDFNLVLEVEDVEEVNIILLFVIEVEVEDEFEVVDVSVMENIVFGVDDYDEKIDGKGLSKFFFFDIFVGLRCDIFGWLKVCRVCCLMSLYVFVFFFSVIY